MWDISDEMKQFVHRIFAKKNGCEYRLNIEKEKKQVLLGKVTNKQKKQRIRK